MKFHWREVSSYDPEICGVGIYAKNSLSYLQPYTAEIGRIDVAAIDSSRGEFRRQFPVDIIIDKNSPKSWMMATRKMLNLAHEKDEPTVIRLQHEYALAGVDHDKDDNMVPMLKEIRRSQNREQKVISVVNLHTVLRNPSDFKKRILQQIAENADGMVLQSERGLNILTSDLYGIPPEKLVHIDHGVRVNGSYDPNEVKKEIGVEGMLISINPGLISPGKGIEFDLEAYGGCLEEHVLPDSRQRRSLLKIVAGQPHPKWVKENPEEARAYTELIINTLNKSHLKYKKVHSWDELSREDKEMNDVILLEANLSERLFENIFKITDIVTTAYRNKDQMSSGPGSEAAGASVAWMSTKFDHAIELIYSNHLEEEVPKGLLGGNKDSRGILVDLEGKYQDIPSVSQLKQGYEKLLFDRDVRLSMGINLTREKGIPMAWESTTKTLMNYVQGILHTKFGQRSDSPEIVSENSNQ